ncbi:hypothetical protein F183_A21930 [Bryobacterales bacterium F-183]|nr:hypothetical protein F183_A21930 [Bryobacterales bacterium F-183]
MISRLGDVTLAAALILTYQTFGTWSLDGIFAGAVRMREAGPAAQPEAVGWICGLLVFAALLKSAQFPFHSWLPDTMETPTPVSALMHAGVINAGGMLIIRFRDLITLSDGAMLMLCIIGGFTALFASAVMLTQASVKRCLAFSTVAQMGFMMFECGAGAFHLALLHLVAHSLYKAHAFLSAGGAVSAGSMPRYKAGNLAWLALCLIAALAVTFGTAVTLGVPLETQGAFHLIFAVGLAQMFWNFPPVLPKLYRVPLALACAVVAAEVYFRLEKFAQTIAGPSASDATWAAYTVAAFFLLAAIAQNQLPRIATSKLAYAIYVHARSGFYINTLANRLTLAVWPSQLPKERVKWLQAWS